MDLNGLCMTFARPHKLQGNVILRPYHLYSINKHYPNDDHKFGILNKFQVRNIICYTGYRPRHIRLAIES